MAQECFSKTVAHLSTLSPLTIAALRQSMDASDASVNNDIIARTMNNCVADGSFSTAAVCIWTVNDAQFNTMRWGFSRASPDSYIFSD